VKWLLGAEPPREYLMAPPAGPGGRGGRGGTPPGH
jgi:hypothetical protein